MTRIADVLASGPTYSFEFFPPKTDSDQRTLIQTLRDLESLSPSFVSVTYGAGGSTRVATHDLIVGLLRTTNLLPMAHLTCAAHTRLELVEILLRYARAGITNLLALGGDSPAHLPDASDELAHADELVALAQAIHPFCVGVAAHPEGHPRSPDRRTDRLNQAAKLRSADFAITQFFFREDDYLSLVNDLADLGVEKPVIPGIMPISNLSSVARMAQMSGASLPAGVVDRVQRAHEAGGTDEVRKVGIDIATTLCQALLAEGAPGLHFYTLNRSTATREIYANLGLASRS